MKAVCPNLFALTHERPSLLWQTATPAIVAWFGGRTLKIPLSGTSDWTPELFCDFYSIYIIYSRSLWCWSTGIRGLGLRVRIPPAHGILSLVSVVCCKERSLLWADHLSIGVITSVVHLSVIVRSWQWEGPGRIGSVAQWKKKMIVVAASCGLYTHATCSMPYPPNPSLIWSLRSQSVKCTNHEALLKSRAKTATWKTET